MTTTGTLPISPSTTGEGSARHSTVHVRVTIDRAEILENQFVEFSVVEIRECLEGEPLKQAVEILNWALDASPKKPYRALRAWARKNAKGFYSPALRKTDANEEYRLYMLYLRRKGRENEDRGRGSLLPSEIEALTRRYYAPEYRARMASISGRTSKSCEAG